MSVGVWIGVVFAAWGAVGCARRADARKDLDVTAGLDALWWSPELSLRSRDDIPAALTAPFVDPYEVTGPELINRTVALMTNCESLLALRAKDFDIDFENDRAILKLESARCQTLRMLAKAPGSSRAAGPALSLDRDDGLSVLPPSLGPGPSQDEVSERQEATRRGVSWATFNPDARLVPESRDRAVVKGADWTTQIEVLARGDFTGDGVTDVLVRTRSSLEPGTSYHEIRLHVLSRVAEQPTWDVASEPPL